MIKITNGREILTVTNGAFNRVFSKQGYISYNDALEKIQLVNDKTKVEDVFTNDKKNDIIDNKTIEEELQEYREKDKDKLNKDDIKRIAELLEIDLSGISKFAEAKEKVLTYLV